MGLLKTNLKQANFTSPQSGDHVFGRYVLETQDDLEAFCKEIKMLRTQKRSISECIDEGYTVLLTDPNRFGYPTYCFECKDKNNTHPSSFHRVID